MKQGHPLFNSNKLKLGLFCVNSDGALSANTLPENWRATWDNSLALAKLADEAGLEMLLSANRWIGHGGASGWKENGIEPIVWAAGLAQATRQIALMSTLHVPMYHPILAAKQTANLDHLLRGRFGINIVCGMDPLESALFGVPHTGDRTVQYAQAQEWIDIVRAFWERDDSVRDFDGTFFTLKNVHRAQGPGGYDGNPVVINAAFSSTGRTFASRNADFLLTTPSSLENAAEEARVAKEAGLASGRELGVIATTHIICRASRAEAEDYYARVLENTDDVAVDTLMERLGIGYQQALSVVAGSSHATTLTPELYDAARTRFISGEGTLGPLLGTPDEVADMLHQLSDDGYHGVVFGLTNFLEELPFLRDRLLPKLEQRGLRSQVA